MQQAKLNKLMFAAVACSALAACTNPPMHDQAGKINYVRQYGEEVVLTPPTSCPDWTQPTPWVYDNRTMSNFRCATNRNIGQMAEDPKDLLRGKKAEKNGHAVESVNAIDRFYNGNVRTIDSASGE